MREMLESLRLPGESQQIDRIAETFASVYFASKPGKCRHIPFLDTYLTDYHHLAEIKTQDAVYVLAYSIIMLNTDLHNPHIRVNANFLLPLFHSLPCLETNVNRGLSAESEGTEWRRKLFS